MLIVYDGWAALEPFDVVLVVVGPVIAIFTSHIFSASLVQQVELGRRPTMREWLATARFESRFLLLAVPALVVLRRPSAESGAGNRWLYCLRDTNAWFGGRCRDESVRVVRQVGVGGMAEVNEPANELEVDVLGADDLLRRRAAVRGAEDEGAALGAAHAPV